MASNILTTASFATASMKPVPGEQIDALWGQNIADNTGFLYFSDMPQPSLNLHWVFPGQGASVDGSLAGTSRFLKRHGLTRLCGSVSYHIQSSSAQASRLFIDYDGTSVMGTLFSSQTNFYLATAFDVNVEHLTNGSWYDLRALCHVDVSANAGTKKWGVDITPFGRV